MEASTLMPRKLLLVSGLAGSFRSMARTGVSCRQ